MYSRLRLSQASSLTRLSSIATQVIPRHGQFRSMASNAIPKVMKGVIIEKNGGTEVLQYSTDLPVPEPKEGQVLVKNEFLGVNFIDTYFRTGLYKAPRFPYTLGREAAGVVVAKGPGDTGGLSEGDRVVWL